MHIRLVPKFLRRPHMLPKTKRRIIGNIEALNRAKIIRIPQIDKELLAKRKDIVNFRERLKRGEALDFEELKSVGEIRLAWGAHVKELSEIEATAHEHMRDLDRYENKGISYLKLGEKLGAKPQTKDTAFKIKRNVAKRRKVLEDNLREAEEIRDVNLNYAPKIVLEKY